MTDDPLIGRQLANFRVERAIGRGGMAQVYYGQDIKLKRPVAIKVIDVRHRDKPAYAKRFVREAQTIAKWRHEHIIQIYYANNKADLYYFVMEYIDGQDLSQIIAKYKTRGKLMPQAEVLRIGRAVASALDYAHQKGIVHRDVKPPNVIVAKNGRVVLTDFGLALDIEQGSLGEVFGSANYVAPEQARHSADAVPQSDLYSLGVMLYEMLTGRVPFEDPSATTVAIQHLTVPPPPPRKLNPKLDKATEAVLLKALSKAPNKRYQSGAELMNALANSLGASASTGRRWPLYAGASLLLLVTALLALVLWLPGFKTTLTAQVPALSFLAGSDNITALATSPASPTAPASQAAASTSQAEAFVPPSTTPNPAPAQTPTPLPTETPTATPTASPSPTQPPPATPIPPPTPLADTQRDFSAVQDTGNWEYQWSEGRDSFNWQEMRFDGVCWRTTNAEDYIRICQTSAHPGLTGDIAWRWESTLNGPIRVWISARKLDTTGGDGVVVLLYRNTEEIKRWQLEATDSQGFTEQISLEVVQGDYLFFVVKAGGDSANDETALQAEIYQ